MRAEALSEASNELAVLDKQRLKVWDFEKFIKSCEFGWHRRVKYARRTHFRNPYEWKDWRLRVTAVKEEIRLAGSTVALYN